VNLDSLLFWGWGSSDPDYRRVRIEGYKIELYVGLWLSGEDYGRSLNFTIKPHGYGHWYVSDYVVDSQLQNTAAILLCGAFATIFCYIPAKSIKPKFDERITPILNRLLQYRRGTPKAFLKKCVKCGKEIPIASEECQYCKAKQEEYEGVAGVI